MQGNQKSTDVEDLALNLSNGMLHKKISHP
jgi:hypothetical protein